MAKIRYGIMLFLVFNLVSGIYGQETGHYEYEGVWFESYPGQTFEMSRAHFLTIWRIGEEYLLVDTSTRRPGGATVLFMEMGKLTTRSLVGGFVEYMLDQENSNILYRRGFDKDGRQDGDVLRFIKFSENELKPYKDLLERVISR